MLEKEIDITTPDGNMNTFITFPDEGGPFPVILFLMDAPGKREELHDMARRLATCGYYVMLPNLYYRRARDFVTDGSAESRKIMFEHMNSLSNEMVVNDCLCLLDNAASDKNAADGGAGCVGYCMSGPFAFAAAAKMSDRVKAAASFHGVRLYTDTQDSPHLDADKIKGEIYFGCAETDEWAPKDMIDQLESYLNSIDIKFRIEWYPGTQHGFVFPLRQGMYHKPSAEKHWHRLLALFDRNLKS